MPNNKFFPIGFDENLEQIFLSLQEKDFSSSYINSFQDKPQERYAALKKSLEKIYENVVLGALLKSAEDFVVEINKIIRDEGLTKEQKEVRITELSTDDPLIVLNNHGVVHVDCVINKISELLKFNEIGLTAYEMYLLLCATLIHDIGNILGREKHEISAKKIFELGSQHTITDTAERLVIEQIALAHSGKINGNKDKIGFLKQSNPLFAQSVREQLLAALLRFGDELADDYQRVEQKQFELELINESSKIYHEYSRSLSPINVNKDDFGRIVICLNFTFDSKIALICFKKNGKDVYLLDEIYERTLKMERERRYCNRFLKPFISIDYIQVDIQIYNFNDSLQKHSIIFTLEEKGYPIEPTVDNFRVFTDAAQTGKEEAELIKKEWGI